jgi:hypothetical protein
MALRLSIKDGETETPLAGLMVNESYTGFACVYVGRAIEVNSEILWEEAEDIRTPCKVMRCQNLCTDVFLMALEIAG